MTDHELAELFALLSKISGNLDRVGAALERLAQPNASGSGIFGPSAVHHYHHHHPQDRGGGNWGGA